MAATLVLLIPFFGLIAIGYVAARFGKQGTEALGWMNTLLCMPRCQPCFFKLVSRTPIEDLTRVDFILTQLAVVYAVFGVLLAVAMVWRKATMAEGVVQAFGGAYGNIGYMGPGLALLVLGDAAAVPVALIVCFENALHFIAAPALRQLPKGDDRPPSKVTIDVLKRVASHPLLSRLHAALSLPLFIFRWPASFVS